MKYRIGGDTDGQVFQAVNECINDIQAAGVWPYPGVVQEVLESRGLPVDMDLIESSEEQPIIYIKRHLQEQ